jgi:hypothetical protein
VNVLLVSPDRGGLLVVRSGMADSIDPSKIRRHSSPVAFNPAADTGEQIKADMDRDSIDLSARSLTDLEHQLRSTPVTGRRSIKTRQLLRQQILSHREFLRQFNVPLPRGVSDAEDVAWHRRRRQRRNAFRSIFRSGPAKVIYVVGAIVAFVALIVVGVRLGAPSPEDRGRETRTLLEIVARNEIRYAARNRGQFTETIDKLQKVERDTSGRYSDAEEAMDLASNISIIARDGSFNVSTISGPSFTLTYSERDGMVGPCKTDVQFGCVNGTWTPASPQPVH